MQEQNRRLETLSSELHFLRLPQAFYHQQAPLAIAEPKLVIASSGCCDLLDIAPASLASPEGLALLSGASLPEQWQPLAMKYFGHQFGYLNPDLGDGRGLLLAEVASRQGIFELHLKGAGPTPFSRQGDGRAVLRSSIREFLASEAMHALGIASTRALAVVAGTTPVQREQLESAATLLRVTRSHLRFGHFEFAYHSREPALLEALCDYACEHYFPALFETPTQNAALFQAIATATAKTIAQWQCYGFAHGVLNTDNMSILGETFDYGPFAFLDRFESSYICNHSDQQGRYAFDRQPAIGHWNLSVLAQALSPLLDKAALSAGLQAYSDTFNEQFMAGMRAKLGCSEVLEADQMFIFDTLRMLQANQLDYPWFFRQLSERGSTRSALKLVRDECLDPASFDAWLIQYQQRLTQEQSTEQARQALMLANNPKYVLRQHLAQQAIKQAEQGDYSEVQRLHSILSQPYAEQPEHDDYAALPPEWAQGIALSCSS